MEREQLKRNLIWRINFCFYNTKARFKSHFSLVPNTSNAEKTTDLARRKSKQEGKVVLFLPLQW